MHMRGKRQMIRKPCVLAAVLFLVGTFVSNAGAAVFHVDDDDQDPFECEGAQYRTIAAAMAVAHSGDEIRICPGVYPEQVVLTHPLRLTGISFGSAQPVIRPTTLPESRTSLLGGNPITA